MDSVTQIALGAAVAEAGFTRRLGPKALAVGALTALLPDLDMFAGLFGDEWTVLSHHRGITHSLLVTPLLALGVGWLGWKWSRPSMNSGRDPESIEGSRRGGPRPAVPPGRGVPLGRGVAAPPDDGPGAPRERSTKPAGGMWPWVHLAFWAHVTHVMLDWCTSYGTMLLYPLSFRRFANDAIAIIDPLYSIPLFAGLAVAILLRRRGRAGRGVAAGTLAVTTLYIVFGWALTQRSVSFARAELARQGFEPVAVRATPMLPVPFLRFVSARDEEGNLRAGAMSPFSSRPIEFARIDLPDDPLVRSLVEKALASERGRTFEWFADGMVSASVDPPAGGERDEPPGRGEAGSTVRLGACHYGFVSSPGYTPFGARFEFDEAGELVRASRSHEMRLSVRDEFAAAWRLFTGRTSASSPSAEGSPTAVGSVEPRPPIHEGARLPAEGTRESR